MLDTRSTGPCQKCRVLEIAISRACNDREKAEIEHAYTVYVTHLEQHSDDSSEPNLQAMSYVAGR